MSAVRGEFVDIGGRRLRAVRRGPAAGPLVLLEAGSFGCAADWAVVQARLEAQGLRSLAYDRAGLGYSDPAAAPRDGAAVAADLDALLQALGEDGPLVLVAHSMAGLYARVAVSRLRQRVLGVVLVDAVTPELSDGPVLGAAVGAYAGAMRMVRRWSWLGFMKPLSRLIGDNIGLDGEARSEKRRVYASASHARWAADEVVAWPRTAELGRAAGSFEAGLPVAVVTAGDPRRARRLKALLTAPALASRSGQVRHVPGANHASLLGRGFADPIVDGVRHVLAASPVRAG